jgi:uncharacterized SAM-binding protein YcdF (DUF218 family)
MPDPFLLKYLLKAAVLPPTGPLLVALVGLAIWPRRPRTGRALAFVGVGSLLVLSMPVVALLLGRSLGTWEPLDLARAKSAQAIVILGGGIRRNAADYGGDTLATLTLERVRYGARVAQLTGLPVLVTGGTTENGETEASVMRVALEREYGVPVRWAEDASRNTHENAQLSGAILRRDGIARIVLVAHGFDMKRATAEFAAVGIETVPAPTGIRLQGAPASWRDFVPGVAGLQQSYYALYEILGNAVLSAVPR